MTVMVPYSEALQPDREAHNPDDSNAYICRSIPHTVCGKPSQHGADFALSSFELDNMNYVEVLKYLPDHSDFGNAFHKVGRLPHYFPSSCIQWAPSSTPQGNLMILTGGDHLRIWNAYNGNLLALLAHKNGTGDKCVPVSGMHWCAQDAHVGLSCDLHGFLYHWDMNMTILKGQAMQFGSPLFDAKLNNTPHTLGLLSPTDFMLMDLRVSAREAEVHQCKIRSSRARSLGKLAWHENGNTVAVTYYDGGVSFYDTRNLKTTVIKTVAAMETIADIAWHPLKHDYLVSTTETNKMLIWSCPGDGHKYEANQLGATTPVHMSRVAGSASLATVRGTTMMGLGVSAPAVDNKFCVTKLPTVFEETAVQSMF